MHISALARLAGTSVRTVRHYHSLGLLPVPPEGRDGWRDYDLTSLSRLLRIRQLAEAGVPLSRVPAVLAENDDSSAVETTLRELDDSLTHLEAKRQELEGQERRLRALRDRVARTGELSAVPPELSEVYSMMLRFDGSETMRGVLELDRQMAEISILLGADYTELLRSWGLSARDVKPIITVLRKWLRLRGRCHHPRDCAGEIEAIAQECLAVTQGIDGWDTLLTRTNIDLLHILDQDLVAELLPDPVSQALFLRYLALLQQAYQASHSSQGPVEPG